MNTFQFKWLLSIQWLKCHIQPTQYQTCYNSISEVVVLKFDKKGDTPNKHFTTWHSVHVLKQVGSTETKLNFVKPQSLPLIFTLGGIHYNQGASGIGGN